ncbi:hypothetical protein SSX86_010384 [Deinandra increscens subsp. villosa]|uniref:Uncharacterized protein n=1 Tax=Deinandra increscens subsp. villosa TaxID=3103831 RepID=A0AAP0D7F7_9ASTR
MDGNMDEALRCLKIGKDALGLGDRSRALKFISKAQRLDPSLPVTDLLSNLETDHPADESPSKPAPNGAGDSSSNRRISNNRARISVDPSTMVTIAPVERLLDFFCAGECSIGDGDGAEDGDSLILRLVFSVVL